MNVNQEILSEDIEKLHFLITEIKSLDHLLDAVQDKDLQNSYAEQMFETIDKYKQHCSKLKEELNLFFQYEKDNSLPQNFNLHRLYKVLVDNN